MELLQKNVVNNTPPNNRTNKDLCYDYWNFLKNFPGMIANVAIIDESPTFAVGKAFVTDNDYFVVRAIGEGVNSFQWEAKFQCTDNFGGLTPFADPDDIGPPPPPTDGLFVKLSPGGGWIGFGVGGFGANPTTGNRLVFDGTGFSYEAFFWANGNRVIAVIDLAMDLSYDNGWYLGKINGVESPVDDPLPCVLLHGIPGRSGAPGTWGSAGYGWQLDQANLPVRATLDPVA
jgi:hypothetical protein